MNQQLPSSESFDLTPLIHSIACLLFSSLSPSCIHVVTATQHPSSTKYAAIVHIPSANELGDLRVLIRGEEEMREGEALRSLLEIVQSQVGVAIMSLMGGEGPR